MLIVVVCEDSEKDDDDDVVIVEVDSQKEHTPRNTPRPPFSPQILAS